jgi:hypothetical protein
MGHSMETFVRREISARVMKTIAVLACLCLLMLTNVSAAEKLHHVVSFKFKSTAAPADIDKVVASFKALKHEIPQVATFDWGTNVSKENHDKGFTHCFVLTFKSEKDRDAYIEHPRHKAFAQSLGPVLEDALVLDFWPGK